MAVKRHLFFVNMSLIEQAQRDVRSITSNLNEFGLEITMIAPAGETAIVNGLHTKHHLGIDTEGNMVNARNAHVSVSEYNLIEQYFPYRDNSGDVNLINCRVNVKDSTGNIYNYICKQWFPDETVGLIVVILAKWQS